MGKVEGRGFISGWGKKPVELPVIELQVKRDRLICIGGWVGLCLIPDYKSL